MSEMPKRTLPPTAWSKLSVEVSRDFLLSSSYPPTTNSTLSAPVVTLNMKYVASFWRHHQHLCQFHCPMNLNLIITYICNENAESYSITIFIFFDHLLLLLIVITFSRCTSCPACLSPHLVSSLILSLQVSLKMSFLLVIAQINPPPPPLHAIWSTFSLMFHNCQNQLGQVDLLQ